jgi:hypothetical protein
MMSLLIYWRLVKIRICTKSFPSDFTARFLTKLAVYDAIAVKISPSMGLIALANGQFIAVNTRSFMGMRPSVGFLLVPRPLAQSGPGGSQE